MTPTQATLPPADLPRATLGVLIIVLNYANFLLPGGTQQHWLWIGLGVIGAGFVAATRWR